MVTVIIETYRRAWALPHSLESLAKQTRKPDEVLIVLKDSNDGSRQIVDSYANQLAIRVLLQNEGNVAGAVDLAIGEAHGKLILFLDDDAIADENWIERYVSIFSSNPNTGGLCGITFVTDLKSDGLVFTKKETLDKPTRGPHRKRMRIFEGYSAWISVSGYTGISKSIYKARNSIIKAADPGGANMGWLKEAIQGVPLATLYVGSRKGFMYEHILAFYARKRGYDIFLSRDPNIAPIVWHISSPNSLSRGGSSRDRFWKQYDKACSFWRLRLMGAELSLWRYFFALGLTASSVSRSVASLYGLIWSLSHARAQSALISEKKLPPSR